MSSVSAARLTFSVPPHCELLKDLMRVIMEENNASRVCFVTVGFYYLLEDTDMRETSGRAVLGEV